MTALVFQIGGGIGGGIGRGRGRRTDKRFQRESNASFPLLHLLFAAETVISRPRHTTDISKMHT